MKKKLSQIKHFFRMMAFDVTPIFFSTKINDELFVHNDRYRYRYRHMKLLLTLKIEK